MKIKIDELRFATYLKHAGFPLAGFDDSGTKVTFFFDVGNKTEEELLQEFLLSEAFAVLDAHDSLWNLIKRVRRAKPKPKAGSAE